MKKQFFRVKQLADQTFLRADKSEGLNHEELQIADHKVEFFKNALTSISKRIPSVGGDKTENIDKRMKKYPEYSLGAVLIEQSHRRRESEPNGKVEEEYGLFQSVLRECGQVEVDLAKEQAEHEIKVEQMVSSPIQNVLDVDLPNILKQKRNLSKYILDKDSANSRYNATKNGNQKEALKDDLDEADSKVEQSRDVLASEMFSLLRKENELSQYVLQLLKLQRGYHESALKNLEKIIPELERKIGDSSVKAIFGVSLEEHLRVTGRRIAFPIELCVSALLELGMSEEGLFRVAGGTSRVKRFKLSLDSGCFKLPLIAEYRDVHVIASILKSYLRELPEPLLTYKLYNDWMSVMNYPGEEQRFRVVQEVLRKLPAPNVDNLTYLIQFLAKLSKHPENKMSSSNIAIVIAPNLLWNSDQEKNMHMSNCTTINLIVELFINKVDVLFPDDVSVYATLSKDMLFYIEEFHRPVLHNVKLSDHDADYSVSTDSLVVAESPKPQSRRKAKPAPIPPASVTVSHRADGEAHESTLTRPHKQKEPKMKSSIGINTDESTLSGIKRRKSLVDDPPKTNLVNTTNASKPPAQNVNATFLNSQRCVSHEYIDLKPVAAPRSVPTSDGEKSVSRTSSFRDDVMSKSLGSIDGGDDVQLRNHVPKPKPEVPVRPASLRAAPRTSIDNSDALHRTQCSVYSIHKLQPSIVNVHARGAALNENHRHQLGHDSQIGEKERFLGHQSERGPLPRPTLENKVGDVNSNCRVAELPGRTRTSSVGSSNRPEVPVKQPSVAKSNEKLNSEEKRNGNLSHVRTRSDGNIIDLGDGNFQSSLLKTPPSPRSISKPTLPPPPPPTGAVKVKADFDSTDL